MSARPTPGPWEKGQNSTYETAIVSASTGAIVAQAQWLGGSGCEIEIANPADEALILEAGTVYHETQLTPRELADQRAELVEVLEALVKSLDSCVDLHPNVVAKASALIAIAKAGAA